MQIGIEIADENRQHFGVGLAGEGVAFFSEELFQGRVVFDDAVVNQRDFPAIIDVWVGVDFIGNAVRRPARVSHAQVGRWQSRLPF